MKERLEEMEARLSALDAELAAPALSPVRLHPNLSALYRRKVEDLAATLSDPEIRPAALEAARALIERVEVREGDGAVVLALDGALSAMLDLAQPGAARVVDGSSVEVVAGAGFEPATFRL